MAAWHSCEVPRRICARRFAPASTSLKVFCTLFEFQKKVVTTCEIELAKNKGQVVLALTYHERLSNQLAILEA